MDWYTDFMACIAYGFAASMTVYVWKRIAIATYTQFYHSSENRLNDPDIAREVKRFGSAKALQRSLKYMLLGRSLVPAVYTAYLLGAWLYTVLIPFSAVNFVVPMFIAMPLFSVMIIEMDKAESEARRLKRFNVHLYDRMDVRSALQQEADKAMVRT